MMERDFEILLNGKLIERANRLEKTFRVAETAHQEMLTVINNITGLLISVRVGSSATSVFLFENLDGVAVVAEVDCCR